MASFCSKCGKETEDGRDICPVCREKQQDEILKSMAEAQKRIDANVSTIKTIILIFFIVAIVGAFAFSLLSNAKVI